MAVIKRSDKVGKLAPRASRIEPAGNGLALPTEASKPLANLLDYSILLYGEKKIGKTTLCSQFPDSLFLMTEPGGKALAIHQVPIGSWKEYLGYLRLLTEQSSRYRTIVVDTVDKLYDLCFEAVCSKLAIAHPQDENDYGKSWGLIRKEFERGILQLLSLQRGVVLIAHARLGTVTKRDGSQFNQIQPLLSGQAADTLVGLVDLIGYYGYQGSDRELVIRGDDFVGAGCRLQAAFRTRKGEQVRSVPMGSSEREAYKNLLSAYRNEQTDPGTVPEVKQRLRKQRS